MTGYEAFTLYHVLKLHFTSGYDFFKYNGKTNITIETFERRKDKYHFYKLSRKFNNRRNDYMDFVISNFLHNDNCWAGTLLEDGSDEVNIKRLAIIQALSYNFQNDCSVIGESGSINDLLKTDGEYPELLTMTLQKVIQAETLCILNSMMNFLPMWQRKISDDIRWPLLHRKWIKYSPFLSFDKAKFREIALKELK
jgi:hypothetical protein